MITGSIKVDFEIETDNQDSAASVAASLNNGLPAIAVDGQRYDATVDNVAVEGPTGIETTTGLYDESKHLYHQNFVYSVHSITKLNTFYLACMFYILSSFAYLVC